MKKLKKKLEKMPKRNHDQYRWFVAVGLLIGFLIGAAMAFVKSSHAQNASDISQRKWRCLQRSNVLRDQNGRIKSLNSDELMERVIEKYPVQRPGVLGKNTISGVVRIQIVIDKDGKVICSRGIEGNPIGIASAIHSLEKWVFRPYVFHGKRRSIAGVLSIPYDFSK